MFVSALLVLALDQASKALVRVALPTGKSVDLSVLLLRQVRNPGTAFGLLQGKSTALFLASIAIFALMLFVLWRWGRMGSKVFRVGMGLIIGGALGNIIDRICLGEVVDFIDLRFWPVFNLADVAIVIGVIVAIVIMMAETWKEYGGPSQEKA